ncbi:MAG: SOS response-associated peptidase [Chlamydiota bacterium]|nr:SOS response-associated peptidase [Chlamydiota bacterium]
MCGRYTITKGAKELIGRFSFNDADNTFRPRYNAAPKQVLPVVCRTAGQNILRMMRWGLIPSWANEASIGQKMINARAETLHSKPSFKRPFFSQRCLVPADGYYEWPTINNKKTPVRFLLKDASLFAFAGLWDRWKTPLGEFMDTYTIITTQANDFIKRFHHRMPVILKQDDENQWLEEPSKDMALLRKLISADQTPALRAYEVSALVNRPSNDHEDCIKQTGDFFQS